MNQIDFSLNIAHLYPDLLNIYGDFGNILAFKNRCLWRGIEINVEEIKAGHRINPDEFDFYFIGGGQDIEQYMASEELLKNKERLKRRRKIMFRCLQFAAGISCSGIITEFQKKKTLKAFQF